MRITDHVRTRKHQDAAAKARKGQFLPSDSSDDEPLPTHTNKPNANIKVYDPRPQEEIDAALSLVMEQEAGGNDDISNAGAVAIYGTDMSSALAGTSTGSTIRKKDYCWKYMRLTNRQNGRGNDLFECIFCNYEGRGHTPTFKNHFCRSCPGVPPEIKQAIKLDGKSKGKNFVKKKADRGYSYMDMDESDLDDVESEGDGDKARSKAVEILTKLLGQRDATHDGEGENIGATEESSKVPASKRRKIETSQVDVDIDLQIKEVQLKKMKAELRLVYEKTEEARERTKLFQSINNEFPNFVSMIKLIVPNQSNGNHLVSETIVGTNGVQNLFTENLS